MERDPSLRASPMLLRPAPAGGRPSATVLALLLLLVGAAPSAAAPHPAPAPSPVHGDDGGLDDLNAKKVASTQKSLAKKQAKEAKLQAKLAARQAVLDAREDDLTDALDAQPVLAQTLADAQDDLAAALALPKDTPEEKAAAKAAIKSAKKAVGAATKAVKKNTKSVNRLQKKVGKLQGKVDGLEQKLVVLGAEIATLQGALDKLEGAFTFQTLDPLVAAITVTDDVGDPVPFVRVSVTDALRLPRTKKGALKPYVLEDLTSPAVYGQGFTDAQGVFTFDMRLPAHLVEFDVVVHKAGYTGDYTEEPLRDEWGVFAPSARVTVPTAQLSSLAVTLQSDV